MNENFTVPPYESHVISGFRTMPPASLDSLNDTLGTSVSPALLSRLTTLFRDVEKRDPTVGEVRFADALTRLSGGLPDRCGAGEMLTDSDAAAAVWADVMERRSLLNGGGSAPCTVRELLSLTDRWLTRTGERTASDKHLFAGPDALSACLAAGCQPVLRMNDETGACRLLGISSPGARTPSAQGDLLLLVRNVPAKTLCSLLTSGPLRPVDAAVLGDRPLPIAVCEMVPGVSIISERLCPDGDDCAARLASPGTFSSPAPLSTLLLRVTASALRQSIDILMNNGLRPVVFGQVQATGRLEITRGGQRVAGLGMTFLRGITAPRLCSVRLPVSAPAPDGTVTLPAVFSLPSPYAGEDGLAPDGSETIALTSSGPSASGYGVTAYTASGTLSGAETAASAARTVLLAAAAGALCAGVRLEDMILSVSLTGRPPVNRRNAMPEADAAVFAAACGLYRAACELRLPIRDPAVTFSDGESSLTVTAWGPAAAPFTGGGLSGRTGSRLMLCTPAPAADGSLDWDELRAMLHALSDVRPASPAPLGQPDEKLSLLPLCRDGVTLRERLTRAADDAGVTFSPAPAFDSLADACFDCALLAEVTDGADFPGVEIGRTCPAEQAADEADAADAGGTETQNPAFKAARTAVLPILRKQREADVRALAAVLRKSGYACTLLPMSVVMTQPAPVRPVPAPESAPAAEAAPVVPDTAETHALAISSAAPVPESAPIQSDAPADAVPAESAPAAEAADDTAPTEITADTAPDAPAAPAPAPIPVVTDASADTLCRQLDTAALLVLAMTAEDAEIMLKHPRIADAVTIFPKTAAVGGACRALARLGLLPEALTAEPTTVPAVGQTLPLTISGGSTPNRLTRLCRTDLLAYSTDAPHLVTIYADGRAVPDGFVGLHKYVGFVNGFPDGFRL